MNHSINKSSSLWGDAWRQLRRDRIAVASFWIIVVYLAMALYGEGVFWYFHWKDMAPPYQQTNLREEYLAPSVFRHPFAMIPRADPGVVGSPAVEQRDQPAAKSVATRFRAGLRALAHHPLGTDNLGRDVFQRTVQGARIAFQVGIITACIAIPIGVILGCLAGYFGGKTDDFIVWLYSTFSSIPGLLFILAIAMVVGKGLLGVYLGIGLTTWVNLCRLIRGEVMKHKTRTYVQAAHVLGLGPLRIMFRHILPNVFHIVIITFSLRFPAAISTEVFMSFLGIGVQGEPSWGIMISNARLRLWQGVWWEMTFVTAAIFFIVLAFNLLGDALRDALDPRLRTSER
ncbi:MAG: ABC transporter permease [Verrucomicrobia bacterium]|nr:ABC transporter permease [Verrucomicrobiota bacterium]MBU1735138.1 ABC transporter permease [Verrucomicrobiota bacterium]MBU1855995.1 ABC transporter permease [Verrucomicrobiota bacterium]